MDLTPITSVKLLEPSANCTLYISLGCSSQDYSSQEIACHRGTFVNLNSGKSRKVLKNIFCNCTSCYKLLDINLVTLCKVVR